MIEVFHKLSFIRISLLFASGHASVWIYEQPFKNCTILIFYLTKWLDGSVCYPTMTFVADTYSVSPIALSPLLSVRQLSATNHCNVFPLRILKTYVISLWSIYWYKLYSRKHVINNFLVNKNVTNKILNVNVSWNVCIIYSELCRLVKIFSYYVLELYCHILHMHFSFTVLKLNLISTVGRSSVQLNFLKSLSWHVIYQIANHQ